MTETNTQPDTGTNATNLAPKNPGWTPGPGVTDHAGRPLPRDLVFVEPPPAELGQVRSAWSELRFGESIWAVWQRVALFAFVTAAVSAAVAWYVRDWSAGAGANGEEIIARQVITTIIIAGVGLTWLIRGNSPRTSCTCSFVCQDGVALLTVGSGRRVKRRQVVPFAGVDALFYSETNRTANAQYGLLGALADSKYRYTFKDAEGKTLLLLKGRSPAGGKPTPSSAHGVAVAFERAWTRYFGARAAAQLASGGHVTFQAGSTEIRVGRGWLEIVRKGKTERITPDQMSHVNVAQGRFNLFVNGEATLLGPRPRLTCPYARVPNGQALFALLAGPFRNSPGGTMRPAA